MKIRSTLIVLLIVIISMPMMAQDESTKVQERSPLQPKQGNVGTTLLISGLIDNIQIESPSVKLGQNILFVRYYLADDLVLRAGFGLDLTNFSSETADSVGISLLRVDSSISNYSLNLSAGVEKHFSNNKRLDPYVFSQLNLTFVGKENREINVSQTFSAGTARSDRTIKADGGIGIGLLLGGGMNYFIAPRFSLGTELGILLQYSNIGGTISDNTIVTSIGGATNSDFNRREDRERRTEIGVETNALINFSYFF